MKTLEFRSRWNFDGFSFRNYYPLLSSVSSTPRICQLWLRSGIRHRSVDHRWNTVEHSTTARTNNCDGWARNWVSKVLDFLECKLSVYEEESCIREMRSMGQAAWTKASPSLSCVVSFATPSKRLAMTEQPWTVVTRFSSPLPSPGLSRYFFCASLSNSREKTYHRISEWQTLVEIRVAQDSPEIPSSLPHLQYNFCLSIMRISLIMRWSRITQ